MSELLESSASVSMETRRMRAVAYEIFKALDDRTLNFMKEIFCRSPNLT